MNSQIVPANTTATVAAQPAKKTDLRILIQSEVVQQQLAMALPRNYTPDQFTVAIRTAINKNPKLAECDSGSFLTSMISAAQMGIAPDGRNGYLIPRWNGKTSRMECTFMPSYIGLVTLVRKNPEVADIYAETVCEHDAFRITKGLHRDIVHEVNVKESRGPIIGVYAVIAYKDGRNSWEFLSREEVEAVRNRSDSWKAHVAKGYDTPWKTDEGEMFKKTALKRLIKLADISQETAERIAVDNTLDITPAAEAQPQPQPAQEVEIMPAALPAPIAATAQPQPMPTTGETVIYSYTSPTQQQPPQQAEKRGPGRPRKFPQPPQPQPPQPQQTAQATVQPMPQPMMPAQPEPTTEQAPAANQAEINRQRAEQLARFIESKGFTHAQLVHTCYALEVAPPEWSGLPPEQCALEHLAGENLEALLDPENADQFLGFLEDAVTKLQQQ